MKALIQGGADVNGVFDPNSWGYTSLHSAAEKGNLDVVNFLLDNGANINAKDVDNQTPLLVANDKVVRTLVERGARIYIKDNKGKTVIDYAQKAGVQSQWLVPLFYDWCDNRFKNGIKKFYQGRANSVACTNRENNLKAATFFYEAKALLKETRATGHNNAEAEEKIRHAKDYLATYPRHLYKK